MDERTRPPNETRYKLVAQVVPVSAQRRPWVDIFRGLLISHMALDHASLMFNAGRAEEELAVAGPPVFSSLMQFLTRFAGVPVAPGFCFMAGFMVALTSAARESRGVPAAEVTKRLIIRGLVLIGVDAVIMGLPRALMGFYSFMVLSSIGVGVIAAALLRNVTTKVLLVVALGVLVLHPLLDVSALPIPLRAVLYESVRTGAFRSMYPVIPWIGVILLGLILGRAALRWDRPVRRWLMLAAVSFGAFLVIRLTDSYGNAYPYASIASVDFWMFAKYPPDLAFLTWSGACVFLSLAVLATIAPHETPRWLQPFEIFGRVPFFFYVVHFYVLGVVQAILRARVGLAETYAIWLALLLVMAWPCVWYYRIKRDRPNIITRYF
jgi:uncharacterized membrane protein